VAVIKAITRATIKEEEEEEVIQDEQRQGDVFNCDAHNRVASFVPFDSYNLYFYRASKQYMQTNSVKVTTPIRTGTIWGRHGV
jgi:hypothetical protein